MPTETLTKSSAASPATPAVTRQTVTARRRRARRLPSLARETAAKYVAEVAPDAASSPAPRCFVCGKGAEAGALEGSGHAGDWVHAACLSQPIDW